MHFGRCLLLVKLKEALEGSFLLRISHPQLNSAAQFDCFHFQQVLKNLRRHRNLSKICLSCFLAALAQWS